ncbi:MAG: carboxymuconolactone decarboxylase family protein [Desulfobacterales bacterium]|nr:carboxymuconolactone decarboxylase family protein [Desulfobacterales bacterium]
MSNVDEIVRRRKKAHKKLLDLKSETYRAFLEMERAAYADGALAKKHKELIAVGISVVIDCESCMQWHIEQAAKDGASAQEVFEALEVGMEMGGGPATVSVRFALEVMDQVFKQRSGSDDRVL